MKVTLKDSKNKVRTLTVVYGFINKYGDFIARVKTDKGCTYFTKSFADGSFECSCPAHRCCWHVNGLDLLKRAYRFNQDGPVPVKKQAVDTYKSAAIDAFYASRAVEIAEQGTLNGNREAVAPSSNASSIENRLFALRLLK
jgi:hypothetical protein